MPVDILIEGIGHQDAVRDAEQALPIPFQAIAAGVVGAGVLGVVEGRLAGRAALVRIGLTTRRPPSLTITGAYQPGKMRASWLFSSVRFKSSSFPLFHSILLEAMRWLSWAALVVFECRFRSASARRLRCLKSSCSSVVA